MASGDVRPHQQAEHMAAPTSNAEQAKSPCQMGAVHTWRITDIPVRRANIPNGILSRRSGGGWICS